MSELLEEWSRRLAGATVNGPSIAEYLPELVDAYTPDEFIADIGGSSWAGTDETGEIVVQFGAVLRPAGLVPSDSRYVTGRVERRINMASRFVRHEHLQLPISWLGRGLGTASVRRSVELYDALGVERVTLTASAYGTYVWAASGFDFLYPARRHEFVGRAHRFADRLGVPIDVSEVQHPWEIAMLDRPVTARQIAEARSEVIEEDDLPAEYWETETPLGKAILLHGGVGEWEGVLRLHAEGLGRRIFDTYTRRNG